MRIEGLRLTVFDSYKLADAFGDKTAKRKERMVVSALPLPIARGKSKSFEPMQDPAFFLKFLDIDETEDSEVLAAIQEFGLIGESVTKEDLYFVGPSLTLESGEQLPLVAREHQLSDRDQEEISLNRLTAGDRISDWRHEIRDLRAVWTLWTALKELDIDRLKKWVVWKDEHHADQARIQWHDGSYSRSIRGKFIPGDLVGPVTAFIREQVEERLARWVSVQLLPTGSGVGLELGLRPENLMGVVWLQMAEAIEKRMIAKRCKECGKWFELRPKMGEKDYCSNACRMRVYRRRNKKHAEGTSA